MSQKPLDIKAQFQWGTNRKWHIANRMVTGHVIYDVMCQIRDPNTWGQ